MDVSKMLLYATVAVEKGKEYARRGLYIFAFGQYQKAAAILEMLEGAWHTDEVSISEQDEMALVGIREMLGMAYATLMNGHTHGSMSGKKKARAYSDEFYQAVSHARGEVETLFLK